MTQPEINAGFIKTNFSKFKGVEVQTEISAEEIADEFDLKLRIREADEMEM